MTPGVSHWVSYWNQSEYLSMTTHDYLGRVSYWNQSECLSMTRREECLSMTRDASACP